MSLIAKLILLGGIAASLFLPSSAHAERRIALVVGNGAYAMAPLQNGTRDAAAVARALQRLGFLVTLATDANKEKMDDALEVFGRSIQDGDVALFYYSGHAVQVQGVNYLLPTSARPNKTTDLLAQAIKADVFLEIMETAGARLNILVLDACRDNPFLSGERSISRGLAIVEASRSEALIAYATAAGKTAFDGVGEHSPYTTALLAELDRPGQTLEDVFRNVRARVVRDTHGEQKPWTSGSIGTAFYFDPIMQPETKTAQDVPNAVAPEPGSLVPPEQQARLSEDSGPRGGFAFCLKSGERETAVPFEAPPFTIQLAAGESCSVSKPGLRRYFSYNVSGCIAISVGGDPILVEDYDGACDNVTWPFSVKMPQPQGELSHYDAKSWTFTNVTSGSVALEFCIKNSRDKECF